MSKLVTIPCLKISQAIAILSPERQVTDESPTPHKTGKQNQQTK